MHDEQPSQPYDPDRVDHIPEEDIFYPNEDQDDTPEMIVEALQSTVKALAGGCFAVVGCGLIVALVFGAILYAVVKTIGMM